MNSRLEGIFPPITTPFNDAGQVWLEKLEGNLNKWNETPLSGYVVLGSNGEACLLDEQEKRDIIATARKKIPDSKTMIVGVGMEATAATVAFAGCAADLGADYLLVGTPHYYKNRMNEAALFAHFSQVADASPVPILLYSVPAFTALPLTTTLVARLASHPNVAGMKYSTRDVSIVSEIGRLAGTTFKIFIGTASVILPAVTMGACGAIVAVACVFPELTVQLFRQSREGSLDAAQDLQRQLTPPALAVTTRFGIAGLKEAMGLNGYYGGRPRPPLLPLTEAERAGLEEATSIVNV